MKNFILIVLFSCINISIIQAQKANTYCKIVGNLSGTRSDTLIVFEGQKQDTVIMKNCKFEYTTKSNKVISFSFLPAPIHGQSLESVKEDIDVIVLPGIPLTISGTFSNYKVGGAKIYERIDALRLKMKPFTDGMEQINNEYDEISSKYANKDSLTEAFNKKYDVLVEKRMRFAMDYIKAHPNNEESATLIPLLDTRIDEGIKYLSSSIRKGRMAPYYIPYKTMLDRRKAMQEISKKTSEGKMSINFVLKDNNGKDFSLSSLRGKYVLLDFWGSWCHWCIKGMPELKKYYEKSKGKLEIVSIDCKDTEENWKAAIAKNQLTWIQVKNEDSNDITVKYGVEGYPTLILIDPQGRIVKRFLGEVPEFFTTLDALFK